MRLFFGLRLGDEARTELGRFLADEAPAIWGRSIRAVPSETLHLTVCFLGECDPDIIDSLRVAATRALAGGARPLRLGARGIGTFPERGSVRVVWAGVSGEVTGLHALERSLVAQLTDVPGVRIDAEEAWSPHWTLGRARGGGRLPGGVREQLVAAGTGVDGAVRSFGSEFVVDRLVLFESRITSAGGARYIERASCPLDGGGSVELVSGSGDEA